MDILVVLMLIAFIAVLIIGCINSYKKDKCKSKSYKTQVNTYENSKITKPLIETYFDDLIRQIQSSYNSWLNGKQDLSKIKRQFWPASANTIFFFHLLSIETKNVFNIKRILTDFTLRFLKAAELWTPAFSFNFFTHYKTVYAIYGHSIDEYTELPSDLSNSEKRKKVIEKLLERQSDFIDFDSVGESRMSVFGYFSEIISVASTESSFDQQMAIMDELIELEDYIIEKVKHKLTLIYGHYYFSLSDEEKAVLSSDLSDDMNGSAANQEFETITDEEKTVLTNKILDQGDIATKEKFINMTEGYRAGIEQIQKNNLRKEFNEKNLLLEIYNSIDTASAKSKVHTSIYTKLDYTMFIFFNLYLAFGKALQNGEACQKFEKRFYNAFISFSTEKLNLEHDFSDKFYCDRISTYNDIMMSQSADKDDAIMFALGQFTEKDIQKDYFNKTTILCDITETMNDTVNYTLLYENVMKKVSPLFNKIVELYK